MALLAFCHQGVSLGLIGDPDPAMGKTLENPGFGLALRQAHQVKAFCRLIPATLRGVHGDLSRIDEG